MKKFTAVLGLFGWGAISFAASPANLHQIKCAIGSNGSGENVTLTESASQYTLEIDQLAVGGIVEQLLGFQDEKNIYSAVVSFPKVETGLHGSQQTCYFATGRPELVECNTYYTTNNVVLKNLATGQAIVPASPIKLIAFSTSVEHKESALDPSQSFENINNPNPVLPSVPETTLLNQDTFSLGFDFAGKTMPSYGDLDQTIQTYPDQCTSN